MNEEEAADAEEARRLIAHAVCLLEKAKCVRARNQAVAAHNTLADCLGELAPPGFRPEPPQVPARFRRFPVLGGRR